MDALEAFATLGLENDASETDIKAAYRKLAKQWHPDVNKDPGAEETFRKINQAYDLLTKPHTAQQPSTVYNPFSNDLFNVFFGAPSRNFNRDNATKSASITIELEDISLQLAEEIAQMLAEKGYKVKGFSFSKQG